MTPTGAIGVSGLEGAPTSSDLLQSRSLSDKQKSLFVILEESAQLRTYIYRGRGISKLSNLNIVRYAIKPYRMTDFISTIFDEGALLPLEMEIFEKASELLKGYKSAEDEITHPQPRSEDGKFLFPNNVVLVDIFATVKAKNPNFLEIKEDEKNKGLAETHTVCLWKKTETQFMIIDPSSSQFSERLKKSVESCLDNKKLSLSSSSSSSSCSSAPLSSINRKCNIVEHPGAKFYQGPEKTDFPRVHIPDSDAKLRDCVDIALKIGIVLNEGVLIYKNSCEVQHSINLLSNQSKVNPILGDRNDSILLKHLQSTRFNRRSATITTFSIIPSIFKHFFEYGAWLKFTRLDNDVQVAILKTLTISQKEIEKTPAFLKTDVSPEVRFERLIHLSNCYDMLNDSYKKEGFEATIQLVYKPSNRKQ